MLMLLTFRQVPDESPFDTRAWCHVLGETCRQHHHRIHRPYGVEKATLLRSFRTIFYGLRPCFRKLLLPSLGYWYWDIFGGTDWHLPSWITAGEGPSFWRDLWKWSSFLSFRAPVVVFNWSSMLWWALEAVPVSTNISAPWDPTFWGSSWVLLCPRYFWREVVPSAGLSSVFSFF